MCAENIPRKVNRALTCLTLSCIFCMKYFKHVCLSTKYVEMAQKIAGECIIRFLIQILSICHILGEISLSFPSGINCFSFCLVSSFACNTQNQDITSWLSHKYHKITIRKRKHIFFNINANLLLPIVPLPLPFPPFRLIPLAVLNNLNVPCAADA